MTLYGRIGQIEAVPEKRGELAEILASIETMPGCLNYIVAKDADQPDVIWITEIWESSDAHKASLELPEVQETISRGRPLIAGFRSSHELVLVGGIGLGSSSRT